MTSYNTSCHASNSLRIRQLYRNIDEAIVLWCFHLKKMGTVIHHHMTVLSMPSFYTSIKWLLLVLTWILCTKHDAGLENTVRGLAESLPLAH